MSNIQGCSLPCPPQESKGQFWVWSVFHPRVPWCSDSLVGVLASETSQGELAAFISYALAFPQGFLCLLDTYDVIRWNHTTCFHWVHSDWNSAWAQHMLNDNFLGRSRRSRASSWTPPPKLSTGLTPTHTQLTPRHVMVSRDGWERSAFTLTKRTCFLQEWHTQLLCCRHGTEWSGLQSTGSSIGQRWLGLSVSCHERGLQKDRQSVRNYLFWGFDSVYVCRVWRQVDMQQTVLAISEYAFQWKKDINPWSHFWH